MADSIIECRVYKDSNEAIQYYKVVYTLDIGKTVEVTVDAVDMDNSADLDEVKSKANTKAKTVKDALVADSTTDSKEASIEGTVTL